MSVGASIFSVVGMRNSDFGVLELMWKPRATRKCRLIAPAWPRVTVTGSMGASETEGPLLPGDCASARVAASVIEVNAAVCQSFMLPNGRPEIPCSIHYLGACTGCLLPECFLDVIHKEAAALQAEFAGDNLAVAVDEESCRQYVHSAVSLANSFLPDQYRIVNAHFLHERLDVLRAG